MDLSKNHSVWNVSLQLRSKRLTSVCATEFKSVVSFQLFLHWFLLQFTLKSILSRFWLSFIVLKRFEFRFEPAVDSIVTKGSRQ